MGMKKSIVIIKLLATLILGFIFPIALIYQSYIGMQTLTSDFKATSKTESMIGEVQQLKQLIHNSNDYKFASLVFLENKNFEVMKRKQIMKVTVIQLGYAMMSIGLMLIMLGFEDKEHAISGGWDSFKLDFKTGSTGALVVVIGAVMATLGGVLKNDYSNNPLPPYETYQESPKNDEVTSMYNGCIEMNKVNTAAAECFIKSYKLSVIDPEK